MPDTTHTHGTRVTRVTTPTHPLDPLTVGELEAGRAVLERAGLLGDSIRFPSVLPVEPRKADVLAWKPGRAFDRSIRYTLLDTATGRSREVVVSVTEDAVTSDVALATTEAPCGQPPYLFEEYERVDAIVKQNPEWQHAMARR